MPRPAPAPGLDKPLQDEGQSLPCCSLSSSGYSVPSCLIFSYGSRNMIFIWKLVISASMNMVQFSLQLFACGGFWIHTSDQCSYNPITTLSICSSVTVLTDLQRGTQPLKLKV